MGKKYLDTKEGSLEQSVLGVWQTAIEEQDARVDGRTKQYKEHRKKLESARQRREEKKKSVNEEQGFSDEELEEMSGDELEILQMDDVQFEATMKKRSAADRKAAAKKRAKWLKTSGGRKSLMKAKKRAAKVRKGQIKPNPKRARLAKQRAKLYSGDEVYEASGDKEAYQKFFNSALKKFGIDSPADLKSDEEKKKFYDYVDKNWEGDHEEETQKESIDWTNSYNREWGTDELRKHTEEVTPGQDGEWTEAVNAKNQTMREALAKVWGVDEGKSPFKKEDKKDGKTLTGKKVASVDTNPTIKEKAK